MNIEKLNEILKKDVLAEPVSLEDYIFIESLIDIVKSIHIPQCNFTHDYNVPLDVTMNLSLDFIKSIDKKYYNKMIYALNNQKIVFVHENISDVPAVISINGEKIIRLVYNNTIYDTYTYTHEGFHYINMDLTKTSINWELMTETISITAEALQKQVLKDYSSIYPEYNLNEIYNMYAIKIKAYKLEFEINLMKHFMKYGYVDDDAIIGLLNNKSDEYKDCVYDDLIEIMDNGFMSFDYLQRYVIAGVLSSHILERIRYNFNDLSEFKYLNDNMYNMGFVDTLKMLDLSLDDEELVILSNNSIKLLRKEYKKRIINM